MKQAETTMFKQKSRFSVTLKWMYYNHGGHKRQQIRPHTNYFLSFCLEYHETS